MSDTNDERGPYGLGFIARELAILTVGVAGLFVLLGLIVVFVVPILGWSLALK